MNPLIILSEDKAGIALNGMDLFSILPDTLQCIIDDEYKDPEIQKFFQKNNIIYLSAGRVIDVDRITKEIIDEELVQVIGAMLTRAVKALNRKEPQGESLVRIPEEGMPVSSIPAFQQELEKAPAKNSQKQAKSKQKAAKKPPGPNMDDRKNVPGYKNLKYLEHYDQLLIWYAGSTVTTTWKKIEEVSRKGLDAADPLVIEIVGGKNAAKNKRTGIRQFVRAFEAGAVKKSRDPEEELGENFAAFQAEEEGDGDPDAVFRPMLTPHYSTRPDVNSGKVEGDMGAGL